ncbi:hypothetical protein F5884DRAFT_75058 [Xylogone sp. PMI_703]|nr:hypothetical protein F5884DRAFT_75058 [Xylogone sp. PMI_703]
MSLNPFDEVLDLEEQFYNDGYQQGLADGVKAGRIEGRTFGLEKGFEKYLESGRLHGKSLVWVNRISKSEEEKNEDGTIQKTSVLPPIPETQRLAKHVKVLYALAESDSLSTENTEEAVSDFDDRLKRAQAKVKIIERMIGETKPGSHAQERLTSSNDGSIEDDSVLKARH